jgi:hypothetical protein
MRMECRITVNIIGHEAVTITATMHGTSESMDAKAKTMVERMADLGVWKYNTYYPPHSIDSIRYALME